MKKKIALMAVNDHLRDEYTKQLKFVLGDIVDIFGVNLQCLKLDKYDQVLAMDYFNSFIPSNIKSKIKNECTLLKTMFDKSIEEKLKRIPKNKRVLIISVEFDYIMECIRILKELGLDHIEYIPYYKEIYGVHIENVDTAIYLGFLYYSPNFIEKFLDIGWRHITYESFLKILDKLQIDFNHVKYNLDIVQNRLYSDTNKNLNKILEETKTKKRVNKLIQSMPIGAILINEDENIEFYNDNINKIFNLKGKEFINKNINDFYHYNQIKTRSNKSNCRNKLYFSHKHTHREYIVTKKALEFLSVKHQYIIFIDEDYNNNRTSKSNKAYLPKYTFENIIGESKKNKESIEYAKKYATTDSTILIVGETGTGKELYANSIHNYSQRRDKPFISINCAAMPDELLESELFGYEGGSFTGAKSSGKLGLFEIANGGTIFLDEIGDTSMLFQVKLLRVLQEKEIVKIGGYDKVKLDIRVISATNKSIDELRNGNNFRKDLFYRLSTCIIHTPSLLQRKSDIIPLSYYFLEQLGYHNKKINSELSDFLNGYIWDGNVRELKNCIEYLGHFSGEILTPLDLPIIYKEYYLNNKKILNLDDYNDEFEELEEDCILIAINILQLLKYKSCGRRTLFELLKQRNLDVSEYSIRKIMDFLEKEGYITKSIGRKGSKIKSNGMKLVEKFEKDNKINFIETSNK